MKLKDATLRDMAAIILLQLAAGLLLLRFPRWGAAVLCTALLLDGVLALAAYRRIRRLETKIEQYTDGFFDEKDPCADFLLLNTLIQKVIAKTDRAYADEVLLKQAELTALQSQINPHFLYNTLDSIQGQARCDNNLEIAEMTAALSAFFRYSINMKNSVTTLADELENVKNYIYIQKYRFGDRINLKIECDDTDALQCRVPQMMLQPLVENAVYHGLEAFSDKGWVEIQISHTAQMLHISVVDTGKGMDAETVARLNEQLEEPVCPTGQAGKRSGIALWNVNQRIKLLFGERCGMHIFGAEGVGAKIELLLPFVREDKFERNADESGGGHKEE